MKQRHYHLSTKTCLDSQEISVNLSHRWWHNHGAIFLKPIKQQNQSIILLIDNEDTLVFFSV